MDWLVIRDLQVECIIGVFKEERTTPQPLVIDLKLGLQPARRNSMASSVDYAALAGQVKFLLASCQFRLIETAAEAVATYLLAPPAKGEQRAQVQRAVVEVRKPKALRAPAVASITIEREPQALRVEEKKFGTVDVVYETKEYGIYRLNVAPGKAIPLHVHKTMAEHELILTAGLHAQGQPTFPGMAFHWPKDALHGYENHSPQWQTIVCVDSPPFIPEDEIETEGTPTRVEPEYVWEARGADAWSLGPEQ